MNILITGVAGFIGFSLTKVLASDGHTILGIDNLSPVKNNDSIKIDRLNELGIHEVKENQETKSSSYKNIRFIKLDISHEDQLEKIFIEHNFDVVMHLAAKTGVRSTPEENTEYVKSNVLGFTNIIENVRKFNIKNFFFASSSSVYGNASENSLSVETPLGQPLNTYAATKQSDERIAEAYYHMYKTPSVGLRFFTVYGPWSRTDMAMYNFTEAIFSGKEIHLFNEGEMFRDFTYIDDVIHAVQLLLNKMPIQGHQIFNVGSEQPKQIIELIHLLEKGTNKRANLILSPKPKSDMVHTCSNNGDLRDKYNFSPQTEFKDGVNQFLNWYFKYKGVDPNKVPTIR
ncbi:MAG: NAD-dependent epimerase/dehydratase family protein [Brumimicrobium sp.]